MNEANVAADLHIVITRDALIIARAPQATFRDFQDQYPGFMTSLGPMDRDAVLDTFENEWPDTLVINKNRIGEFIAPGATAPELRLTL